MVEKIDYSIIIRTTGQAGEKYQKLLNSIEKLTVQDKENFKMYSNCNSFNNINNIAY